MNIYGRTRYIFWYKAGEVFSSKEALNKVGYVSLEVTKTTEHMLPSPLMTREEGMNVWWIWDGNYRD